MSNIEEVGTKAFKKRMKIISLTQDVERNIMEMNYDHRITVTGRNLFFDS